MDKTSQAKDANLAATAAPRPGQTSTNMPGNKTSQGNAQTPYQARLDELKTGIVVLTGHNMEATMRLLRIWLAQKESAQKEAGKK